MTHKLLGCCAGTTARSTTSPLWRATPLAVARGQHEPGSTRRAGCLLCGRCKCCKPCWLQTAALPARFGRTGTCCNTLQHEQGNQQRPLPCNCCAQGLHTPSPPAFPEPASHARSPSLSCTGAALRVLGHAGPGVRTRAFTPGCVRTGASRHRCPLHGRLAGADGCARVQVGAGVLGLPYAFKYLQWPGGMVTIILSYIISLYTLWQLCVLHEDRGKRFNRRAAPRPRPPRPGRARPAPGHARRPNQSRPA
jgi:hypothetical protein